MCKYFYNYSEMTDQVYLDFISSQDGKDFMKYIKNEVNEKNEQLFEYFQNLRKNNLITFNDASYVDYQKFGYCGNRWTSAFNYPREGEKVYIGGKIIGIARNVGLLTFSIE